MKYKWSHWSVMLFLSPLGLFAQEKAHLGLDEIIHLAATQSSEAKAADNKVYGKQLEVETAKLKRLPDSKLSAQYMAMTTPTVDLKLALGEGGAAPDIAANQLWLGMASVNMPLFTGGKIDGAIHVAQDAFAGEQWNALARKEQLAIRAVNLYLGIYKAQQTYQLISENIRQAEQRVSDFKAMLDNGIIARNDLLKAELQLSNYQVSLQEAQKNVKVLNYQLATFLNIPDGVELDQITLQNMEALHPDIHASFEEAQNGRNDVKALASQRKVAEDNLAITKAGNYPTIAASAGYNAFGLQKVVTVTNAASVGIGISYDIGSLYKNKKEARVAQHRIAEIDDNMQLLNDQIKVQVQQANENYTLAQKQSGVYEQAVAQASENYRITKDKYDNGIADTDDLLTADVQQLQSKINLAISKANTIEKYYDLLLANGSLHIN